MSPITTHVLDTATGRPARGVALRLERGGEVLARGVTDEDGRCRDLLPPGPLAAGRYTMIFDTEMYHMRQGTRGFYPEVVIHFLVGEGEGHLHVPLLLSPYGFTTYRGS